MKRDMDLARQILFAVEENDEAPSAWIDLSIPNHSDEEVAYHVMLLNEAGLIEAHDLRSGFDYCYKPKRLTWYGHEFIEAARSDTHWKRAKTEVIKQTGGLSIELLKAALIEYAKKALAT